MVACFASQTLRSPLIILKKCFLISGAFFIFTLDWLQKSVEFDLKVYCSEGKTENLDMGCKFGSSVVLLLGGSRHFQLQIRTQNVLSTPREMTAGLHILTSSHHLCNSLHAGWVQIAGQFCQKLHSYKLSISYVDKLAKMNWKRQKKKICR